MRSAQIIAAGVKLQRVFVTQLTVAKLFRVLHWSSAVYQALVHVHRDLELRAGNESSVVNQYIAVMESRGGKKALQALSRRLRCTKCRRNPANRGLCIHGTTALAAAEELDKQESEAASESIRKESAKVSSTLSRRPVTCWTDRLATQRLNSSLFMQQKMRTKRRVVDKLGIGHVDSDSLPIDHCAKDTYQLCRNCNVLLNPGSNCQESKRVVLLHTLA